MSNKKQSRIEMSRAGHVYVCAMYDSEGGTVMHRQIGRDEAEMLHDQYQGVAVGDRPVQFSDAQPGKWLWQVEVDVLPADWIKDPLVVMIFFRKSGLMNVRDCADIVTP